MSLFDLLILLVIAGICGGVARSIVGTTRGGCLVSIALGFIGALVGMWLARLMDLPEFLAINIGGRNFPIIWSIVGASLFTALISFLSGRGTID